MILSSILNGFWSIDEQSQRIVGEPVFVRAEFISEGVGFTLSLQETQ
jgi:hypothetical protein